ncbi:Matrixin [Cooperia oncophora]
MRYLHRFGYLNSPAPSLHEFRTGLRLFQEVVGVEPTGELTPETVEATKRTRCSQKDTRKDTGRSKRFEVTTCSSLGYVKMGQKALYWSARAVSQVLDDPEGFGSSGPKEAYMRVKPTKDRLNRCKPLSNRKQFVDIKPHHKPEADINILWAEGAHGDQYEFDGASAKKNILAHTFFPGHSEPLNGDIHFDDAETWETDLTAATNQLVSQQFLQGNFRFVH